ncbi:hypothetical protein CHH57_01435 [Niallia circulans]|uniref:GIY-YIG domain-containing protein n=1 Tax=Niallia circulans TaxID=1397 RepID=A0AA91TW87_NIACI|nr:GIY-YIG nuclease family protein [Niallia circulans]PAD85001.1 hypothetical protein CHH57_01435 [Niallia circulans]
MFSESELSWMREVLKDDGVLRISPSYFYKLKTDYERNSKREQTRKELDLIRNRNKKYSPEDLLKLKNYNIRRQLNMEDIAGIYVIHNVDLDKYYIGQAKSIFDRVYQHFKANSGNVEVFEDFKLGDYFEISIIPLGQVNFGDLNELEDNAIRAYNSMYPNGYNKVMGNLPTKVFFLKEEYSEVAMLILDRMDTELLDSLTNVKTRKRFLFKLYKEYNLPSNGNFHSNFIKLLTEYNKQKKGNKI